MHRYQGYYVADLRKKFKRPDKFFISKAEKDFVVDCLARKIAEDYRAEGIERISLVPAMDGAIPFLVDFARTLLKYGVGSTRYTSIDIGSYQPDQRSSGQITPYYNDKKLKKLEGLVKDFPTLFIDEMIETGLTFNFSADLLEKFGARLKTTSLILRPAVYYSTKFELKLNPLLPYGGIYTLITKPKRKKQLHKRLVDYVGFFINKKPFLEGMGMDGRDGFGRFCEDVTPVKGV